jgi:hypothetical protein
VSDWHEKVIVKLTLFLMERLSEAVSVMMENIARIIISSNPMMTLLLIKMISHPLNGLLILNIGSIKT